MSEKIKSSDIFEGDIFKIVVDSADLAKTKIAELNKELVEVGTSFKKELNGIKADNVKEIEALIVKVKELTKAVDAQTQVNKANEIAMREAKKTSEQALREEEKTKREALKTQEQINKSNERAVKNQKDLSDAYKQLAQNTRDLKNESKRLGAEMLELEKQGKKNSAEYYKLSRQYKETTKSAVEGDKALKKLDSTVGDNFRNVGNYSKAIGGLKNALMQLGLAFGVFDGIRALLDTQIKLDSLNLSLKNVSSSTKEYQANFAFLKDLSLSYGQDLLVLIDSYKNFIASTSSSNLSLTERKRIYESVIKAGSALALSNDNIKGSLLAISQMFSKGTVSAEELRQQLGERLPGAFGIMAESMGVTEAELGKLMKEGKVLADDVMPRFAILLERSFGENAKARLETFGGAWNVLKNNVTLYFDQVQKSVGVNKVLAGVILGLGNNIGGLLNNIRQLIIAFVSFKVLLLANEIRLKGLSVGFLNMAKNALTGSNAVKVFGLSLKNIFFIAVIDGIVKLTDRFFELSKGIDIARRSYEIYQSTTTKGKDKGSLFVQSVTDEYFNTKDDLTKKLKDKKISQAEFNKKMDEAEIKRLEKTQKRIRELEISIAIGDKSVREIRTVMGGNPVYLAKKARENRGLMENLLNTLGIETKSGDLLDVEFFAKLYQKEQGNINDFKNQLQKIRASLSSLKTPEIKDGGKGKDKGYAEKEKPLIDLNTEYKTTNEYLSRQVELQAKISEYELDRDIIKAQEEYNKELEKQQKILENTGDYAIGSLYYASEDEKSKMIASEQKQFDNKKLLREKDYKEKYDELNADLEQEKIKKIENAQEIEDTIALKRRNANKVLKTKGTSDSARQSAKDDLKWAIEQEEYLKIKKLEINDNYEAKKAYIEEQAKNERRDLDKEELNELRILGDKKADIEKQINEKIAKDEEQFELKKAEMRLDRIKKTAESVNTLIQKSLEHYINMAERRIDMLDKRMDRMSTQADFLREKAVAGNIQAQESLAVIDKQEIEAQKERINEQRSIQRLQMAMTVFQAYSNNIQNAKIGENPFTKTLTDITLLNQVINSLPTFIDGTETNIASALGKPHLQGQDGYIVRVDGSEKVLNPQLSAMTGNMTTMEIAKLAEDFRRGDIMRKGEGAMQLNVGSWGTDMIISELQDLKNVIKNKPENQVEVAEILNGVMHIVETKKSGNTKVRNISRFS
jgi:tape measure domain-containing protein